MGKPVQLLEWGEGTNTLNQRWEKIAEGVLVNQSPPFWQVFLDWLFLKRKVTPASLTTLVVAIDGQLQRKNSKDEAIKVVQQGEGMTPTSTQWGEVAVGRLKSIESQGSKTLVYLEVKGATKIGR
jgi:hypothetical protein